MNKKLTLIGITGKARSGKDTVGNYIKGMHNFNTYAFADPIKKAASIMFGIPLDYFYDDEHKERIVSQWDLSPRQIMQTLGTEGGRDLFRQDIWVKRGEIEWANFCANNQYRSGLIFTDVRFENEAEMIRLNGGHIIHIERENVTKVNEHISEQGITFNLKDIVIHNDKTKEDLFKRVDDIMKKLGV